MNPVEGWEMVKVRFQSVGKEPGLHIDVQMSGVFEESAFGHEG